MINVQQLYGNVRSWLWEFFATEANSDQDIVDYINRAIAYVCSQRDWQFLDKMQTISYATPYSNQSIQEVVSIVSVYKVGATDEIPVYDLRTWRQSGDDGVLIYWSTFQAKVAGTFEIVYQWTAPIVAKDSLLDFPSHMESVLYQVAVYFWLLNNQKMEDADQILALANEMMRGFANRHTSTNVTKKTGVIQMGSGHSF